MGENSITCDASQIPGSILRNFWAIITCTRLDFFWTLFAHRPKIGTQCHKVGTNTFRDHVNMRGCFCQSTQSTWRTIHHLSIAEQKHTDGWFIQARDLYRIHPLLDLNTSVLLANALVSSRLDYCNSLSLSLTDSELRRLQLVQNLLCRVITRSSKFSPQHKKLHWLSVRYRVQFKIGLITYKILNQGQPV